MTKLNSTHLPDMLTVGRKLIRYKLDMDATHMYRHKTLIDIRGRYVLLRVLSRNLRGKTDLHGRPYTPNEWIYTRQSD